LSRNTSKRGDKERVSGLDRIRRARFMRQVEEDPLRKTEKENSRRNRDFFVGSMVFDIVQLVCIAVLGHDVVWVIAVPQQHSTFEHFGQTGAAVHPALFMNH
jgi:hypothetical protein